MTLAPRLTGLIVAAVLAALVIPAAAGAQAPACPCSVFAPTDAPGGNALEDSPVEVGMKIVSSQDGYITALRFYKQPNNTGVHTGHLWSANGTQLAEIQFTNETAEGWQEERLPTPVPITANTTYVVSYYAASGRFGFSPGGLGSGAGSGTLTAPADGVSGGNGVYRYGSSSSFPDQTWGATNYWVDAVFEATLGGDTRGPRVRTTTPANGAIGVPPATSVRAEFDEPLNADSVTSATFTLRDPEGTALPATVSYEAATRTATLNPSAPLDYGVVYTATLKGGPGGVADNDGNPMAADHAWSFTGPPRCPCTVFSPTDGPLGDAMSDSPLEIGMKFRASEDGYITALRFYKQPNNTGTHVGHLWSSTGDKLAEVEFTNETPSGWQEEQLAQPVRITRDTTYITSYHSSAGHFAFSNGGLSFGISGASPLSAPADGLFGGNGVYKYGASAFPTDTFAGTNYWVDASFDRTLPPDTRPPRIASLTPAPGGKGATVQGKVTVTFDEPMDRLTINTGSILLKDSLDNPVVGTVAYDDATRTATLTPSADLRYGETYTASVLTGTAGVTDLAGNRIAADRVWTFSTPSQCPCRVFAATDAPAGNAIKDQPLEIGMKFRPTEDGYITELRFYKQPNNTGSHTGHLWAADGTLLATAAFTAETASGWQTAPLPNPVPVVKNTTYVTSYYSSAGFFAFEPGYFSKGIDNAPMQALANGVEGGNGVYHYGASAFPSDTWSSTNYWVDATFERTIPPDTRGPTVVDTVPVHGVSDVPKGTTVAASFDEPLTAASVSDTTFVLRDHLGGAVAATVAYDAQTKTATLRPAAPLAYDSAYTATVRGGTSGVKDAAGNPLATDKVWSFTVQGQPPSDGPGGPILVVTNPADKFSTYYSEILRGEGLNSFATAEGPVTSQMLGGHTTVVLGSATLSDAEVALLSTWVQAGGNLIAMRPDKKLAGLLGITDAAGTLANGYLKVDAATAAGAGIEAKTLQYHGAADRYTLSGATPVAMMYSNASTATTNPAVTLRDLGTSGGQAAAFAFDLARSVVYTRQGNPAWAGQKRDGTPPLSIRPNDLFYGASVGDVQPDWVDPDRIEVPQADEQQRLLANLITQMNMDKAPLPRFWYLPRGEKAAVVLTGDDHARGGTAAYFDRLKTFDRPGCSVADWECNRATSYMYPDTSITDAQVAAYQAEGFELALHLNTGCLDFTPSSLENNLATQLGAFAAAWPSAKPPVSNRTHCIVWSDWATEPKLERRHGIRFDTNYYYKGPVSWVKKPGLMTGSGFPQRFADLDGSMIDVYQAMTQVSDEMTDTLPTTTQIHTLLDNALGPKEYWGVFTLILHSDYGDHQRLTDFVSEAADRGVPVVSSAQMLDWIDGRNGSSFGNIAWAGGKLTFTLTRSPKARGLEAMLPVDSATGALATIKRDGTSVTWKPRTVKGVRYAVFNGAAGSYTAAYENDTTPPDISAVSASGDAEGRGKVQWTTDEPSTSTVEYGRTASLGSEATGSATVTDHSIELKDLQPDTTYTFRVTSVDAAGNSATSAPQTFTTPPGDLVDSLTSEFAAGSRNGTYVGDTLRGTDGEVQLQPTVGEEFDGMLMPLGWAPGLPFHIGGSWKVGDGRLTVDSQAVTTTEFYAPPRTLEFTATFRPVNNQAVGLGNDLSDWPQAAFTTGVVGQQYILYATSGTDSETAFDYPLSTVALNVPHRFRIDWTASDVTFWVDGIKVYTRALAIEGPLRPAASDYDLFGAASHVEWMRMGGYATSGDFTSRVLDSGPGANAWGKLTTDTIRPAGTGLTYETRSGGTYEPDATWSPWAAVGPIGQIASPPARFLQYRARLSGNGTATPLLTRSQVDYTAGTDRAPVPGTVTVSPASPRTSETLTATVSGFSDPDGDPLTYHYRWFHNGTPIAGATTPGLDLSLPGYGDRGDAIRVEVYATDGRGAATDRVPAKLTVANTPPTAGSVTVNPAAPATNDVVSAVPAGYADVDGDQLSYRYQWLRNGVAIAGATAKTLDLAEAGNGDVGDQISVDVRAVDAGGGTSPSARGSATVTGTNATPVPGTVSLAPAAPRTDQTVTATPQSFRDPDGDPLTYSYQWSLNGTAIAGATSATLDLAAPGHGDRGDTISVAVRAADNHGATSEVVAQTATVANTAPTVGQVKLKPSTPGTDDLVAAAPSDFADVDGDALSYAYQWYRNGATIVGATGRNLDLSLVGNGDAGDVIEVEVRALDGHGGTSGHARADASVSAEPAHAVAAYGFEEAAGTVAVNSGGGPDGLLEGAVRTNAGRFGRAVSFEGDDDVVTVPDDPSLRLTGAMTLEAWVKPTATTDWRTVMFKESAGGIAYALYANGVDDTPSVHVGLNGDTGAAGTSPLDPNEWTHLAATYDGYILRFFVNGAQVGSTAASGDLATGVGPLTFGANHVWGERFRGLIDEVRVYNRALTREQIAADRDRSVVTGTPEPPASTQPSQIGAFSKPQEWPITPVHLALLSDGTVAAWDGFEAAVNSEHKWDPWTGRFDSISTGRNLFCAGHITLVDGRLLVVGGHIQAYEGTKETNLLDPRVNSWTRGRDMAVARWYPTATALPDGRVFVVSGDTITLGDPASTTPVPLINASATLPEIYNPVNDTWTAMPSASRTMPLYPYMFLLPDGRLFDAGPDKVTRTLSLSTGQWTTVGTSNVDGGSAVMYRPGKILKSGTWSDPEFPDRQATAGADVIDMTQPSPAWRSVAPMKYRRAFHTLTVLPDGKVLATGGQTKTDGVDEKTGILPAELWDPDTDTWRQMASSHRPRLYHSSAVLLPDGRVLLAGGGAYGTARNEKSGELFSPPYLFKGPRPQVDDAPDAIHYGQSFTVNTPDAARIASISLVRMGTVTHNFDMDQRFMNLSMTRGSGQLTINAPANANIAPPGWYMVFLIDDNGVPSVGQIMQVNAGVDTQAPTAPGTPVATTHIDGATLDWAPAADNVGVSEYRVYRSTVAGFTPGSSNRIARVRSGRTYADRGLPAGTYHYRVTAVDKAGNQGPASGQVTVTVNGDISAPVVGLPSVTGGTSVQGPVDVTTTASDDVGVESVQFKLDGQDLGGADTTSPYSIFWDTTSATDGPHTLTAVARDASGNTTTSAVKAVEIHNTGLVAAYGFEEASGTTAMDAMAHHNGTIEGDAARVPNGRFGQALSFDGVDDMVTIQDAAGLDVVGGMTIEAWLRPSALSTPASVVMKERPGSFNYALFASNTASLPSANVFTTSPLEAVGPAALLLGTWTHLAMTWDGATVRLFVDGAEISAQPAPAPLAVSSGLVRIGGSSLGGQFFSGLIDEVRIYDRPRTGAEIAADLNRSVP